MSVWEERGQVHETKHVGERTISAINNTQFVFLKCIFYKNLFGEKKSSLKIDSFIIPGEF